MGVRMRRRSQSLTNENHLFELLRMNQPDKPIHQCRDSLFSTSSGFNNFRGFFTLALILLVLATLRVALENVMKYGILINYSYVFWWFFDKTTIRHTTLSLVLLHILVYCSYWIELQLSKNQIDETKAFYLICLNLALVLSSPIWMVLTMAVHPFSASFFCFVYLVTFLKLFSYHSVNYWCRKHHKKTHKRHNSGEFDKNHLNQLNQHQQNDGANKLVHYPDNLTIKDIFYFLYVPTLCYELNFPRTDRIRKRFLLKRLFEVIFLTQLLVALVQQWMVPTIHNSFKPLKEMNYLGMLERLLKLSIPNHIIWLIMFYTFFHSYLNLIGEIMYFGDREFYRDWWNAESMFYFWKNWNLPVHRWCVRHLFVPLVQRGFSKMLATMIVFLLSAIFHEYLVTIPLKMFGYWAFMGMVVQIPFVFLVTRGLYANVFIWISLIIGQPLCILACYHDYYVTTHAASP